MLFRAEKVTVGYGSSVVIEESSIGISGGEVVVVCGRNGAGKTTLLRALSGIIPVRGGSLYLDERLLDRVSADGMARLGVSHVPEGRCLFPGLTIRENLILGMCSKGRAGRVLLSAGLDRVCGLFPWIRTRLGVHAGVLSGGEQQMVAIGRGVISEPRILLLDEPYLGLSPAIAGEVRRSLLEIRSQGVALLIVEEALSLASELSPRLYIISGQRVQEGGAALEGAT